jgi:phage shock protein A
VVGILDRLNTLIKANLNSALSGSRGAGQHYQQALHDMDDSLRQARQYLATSLADERRLRQDAERKRQEVERWESRAQAAVRAGDDALAREALSQRRKAEDEEGEILRAISQHRASLDDLRDNVDRLDARIRETRTQRATPSPARPIGDARGEAVGYRAPVSSAPALDDARHFDAFARQERAIDEDDAYAEAMRELNGDSDRDALEARFRDLERETNDETSDALSALKEKLAKR